MVCWPLLSPYEKYASLILLIMKDCQGFWQDQIWFNVPHSLARPDFVPKFDFKNLINPSIFVDPNVKLWVCTIFMGDL